MKKIMLSFMAGVCLAGFSSLTFADELGQMKEDVTGETGKMQSDMKSGKR